MKYIRFIADVLPNLDAATCPVLPPSAGSGGGSAAHPFRVFILLPEAVEALVHPAQQVSEQFFILGGHLGKQRIPQVIYLLAAVVGGFAPQLGDGDPVAAGILGIRARCTKPTFSSA